MQGASANVLRNSVAFGAVILINNVGKTILFLSWQNNSLKRRTTYIEEMQNLWL